MKASWAFAFILLFFLKTIFLFGQQGQWTWMKGDTIFYSPGHFGTQGIPDTANTPPALFAPFGWVDLQGNFWLYGGYTQNGSFSDLWKYDVSTKLWTWIKGTGLPVQPAVYGIQGIPSVLNTPGARSFGSATWIDPLGDLWLFGGPHLGNSYNDLWRYHIATNEWTWMKGSQVINDPGFYGTITIAGPLNNPCARGVICDWIDNNGNFWFFGGGYNIYWYNDVWKYDENTNQWTWMQGSNTFNVPAIYGVQNVPAPQNTPGSRGVSSHWIDSDGNFWFFGGQGYNAIYNDLWKFNPLNLEWTWISGPNTGNQPGVCGGICQSSINNIPSFRYGNSACWKGNCDIFYFYGGRNNSAGWVVLGDLWCFNRFTNEWTFVKGSLTPNFSGHHGAITVPSLSNLPRGLMGSTSWTDLSGNLWLFGGGPTSTTTQLNELWRYVPDTLCPFINPLLYFSISPDTTICFGDSIMLSTSGGINFQWTPTTNINNSNTANPVVYPNNSITYSVSISNGTCHATLSVHVTVKYDSLFQLLTTDTLICNGDSISLQATGGTQYQWTPLSNISNPNIPNPIVYPDSSTLYSVTISNGPCQKTFPVHVYVNSDSAFSLLNHDTTICKGDSIALQATGGNLYQWQPYYHLSDPHIPNPIAFPDTSTTYVVSITNDCFSRTYAIHIQVINDTSMKLLNNDTAICQGQTVQLNATGGIQYLWNNGLTSTSIIVNPLVQTHYFITITDVYGCRTSDSVMIHVNYLPVIQLTSSGPSVCQGSSVKLTASGATFYYWSPQEGLSYYTGNPVTAAPEQTITYTVKGTDQNGCSDSTKIKVEVILCQATIPNVLTPNGDGKNDYFRVRYNGGLPYNILIFNRWGIKLFESNNLEKPWDGKYKGTDVPAGTYYYLVTIGDKHYSGAVTLIR